MKNDQIDELDKKILKLIGENARIPFLEVARECNVSGAAIHQRVTRLIETGVIKGSQYVFDWNKIGYETCAFIGACVSKSKCLEVLVKDLSKVSEVIECYYSSGRYDLILKIIAKNNRDLLNIIQQKLHPLEFTTLDTMVLFEEIFSRQGYID